MNQKADNERERPNQSNWVLTWNGNSEKKAKTNEMMESRQWTRVNI